MEYISLDTFMFFSFKQIWGICHTVNFHHTINVANDSSMVQCIKQKGSLMKGLTGQVMGAN